MDSYLLNHANLPSVYYGDAANKDDGNIIDLGLSLRVLQPEAFVATGHGHNEYGDFVDHWHHQLSSKTSDLGYSPCRKPTYEDEVVEKTNNIDQQAPGYVKVNMEGVIVGRKVCVFDHHDYLSLAFQLEDMFGRHSSSGLRLFQNGSEFSLFYMDRDDQWRTVGDIPWKEFVNSVKRLRIIRMIGRD